MKNCSNAWINKNIYVSKLFWVLENKNHIVFSDRAQLSSDFKDQRPQAVYNVS